ncbi:MAG: class I SAM-dependent methyltransferase [Pseudomonadota bacterium]
MHSDVTDLRDFYATPLGLVTRRLILRAARTALQNRPLGTLLGLGFATPYLSAFKSHAQRVIAVMPARQGALVWPPEGKKQVILCEEEDLPIPDNSVDTLLVAHGLEMADRPQPFLREIWRVLTPEGRLLIIVPNRRGIWARLDTTPFGYGRPFSRGQLERLLTSAMFTPRQWDTALYMPPFTQSLFVRSAVGWERMGSRFMQNFAGAIIVEAVKEMSAPAGKVQTSRSLAELAGTGRLVQTPGLVPTPQKQADQSPPARTRNHEAPVPNAATKPIAT